MLDKRPDAIQTALAAIPEHTRLMSEIDKAIPNWPIE
jgi:hypothetical protein